ncbi:MAG: hypothetical protein ACPG8W_11805 [Candidatus Promineifilaceae bacterium]
MPDPKQNKPTNIRQDRKDADRNLMLLVIFALVVLGGGAIAWVYGVGAAAAGLLCLGGGAVLVLFLWWMLSAIERWRENSDY